MKIKTSELTGLALALAVFTAEGRSYQKQPHAIFDRGIGITGWILGGDGGLRTFRFDESWSRSGVWRPELVFRPDEEWDQGGPIIEREGIAIHPSPTWTARYGLPVLAHHGGFRGHFQHIGATPLIAAMRCYVASKLGDEVDVPEELL